MGISSRMCRLVVSLTHIIAIQYTDRGYLHFYATYQTDMSYVQSTIVLGAEDTNGEQTEVDATQGSYAFRHPWLALLEADVGVRHQENGGGRIDVLLE